MASRPPVGKKTTKDYRPLFGGVAHLTTLFLWSKNPGRTLRLYLPVFTRVYLQMSMEVKYAQGGTKRRRDSVAIIKQASGVSSLSHRVTRLTKQLKASNPTHMDVQGTGATIPPSTTGTLYCLANGISQGDDFYQRFGNHVDFTRLIVKGTLIPGSTVTTPSVVRISVFRAQSGIAFAANLTGTYSPIISSVSTQVLYDKFYSIPSSYTATGFPVNVNINLKLKHRQKFSGAAAAGQTGESLFIICQSDKAAGTTTPAWGSGLMEIYFRP